MLIKYSNQLAGADKASAFTDWMYSEIEPFLKGDILEIGSGIGTYSRKIARAFRDSRKVFSDFDPEYVIELRKEFRDDSRVTVSHLDLSIEESKGIEKESYDSAFALNVF